MKFYLKHQTSIYIVYFILMLSLGVFCGVYFDNFYSIHIGPAIVFLITIFCIFGFVINPIKKMTNMLMKECDPLGYLESINSILEGINVDKKIRKKEISALVLDKATCLTHLGRYDEAVELYFFLQDNLGKMNSVLMRIIYHNLAFIAIEKHDLHNANFYCEKEKEICDRKILKFVDRTHINIYFSNTLPQILMAEGKYIEAENEYTRIETEMENLREDKYYILINAYNMGLIKYNLKKYDQAIPRLQYVAENGNTMVCKFRAEEMLREIRESNENSNFKSNN